MKNLKRVLALVLVVATLAGFATVASADFTDHDDLTNVQAVEILVELGVINGYENADGTYSFKPTQFVTRAEMAKMAAYILNGGSDISNLYEGTNNFEDCVGHWARGYVAYASHVKLVVGVGENMFLPNDNVTATQAAKMMLVALGYDPDIETYTGATWAANVQADAKDAGLFDDFPKNYDYNKAMTRDYAALLMFNALTADMVEYANKGTSITINGAVISSGASKAEIVFRQDPDEVYDNMKSGHYIKDDDSQILTYSVQLAETSFDTLEVDEDTWDDYGRPGTEWFLDEKSIGFYVDEADATYTDAVELADVFVDIGKKKDVTTYNNDGTIKKSGALVFVDGDHDGELNTTNPGSYKYDFKDEDGVTIASLACEPDYIVDVDPDNYDEIGGAGALTQVYIIDDNPVDIRIVVMNTYAGKIDEFVETTYHSNGDVKKAAHIIVEDDVISEAVKNSYTTYETYDLAGNGKIDHDKAGNNEFKTSAYTEDNEGERIIYTVADGKVQKVVSPDYVDGTMDRYNIANNTITIDGTVYGASAKAFLDHIADVNEGEKIALAKVDKADFDGEYRFYFDNYGNVIYAGLVDADINYAYVVSVEAKGDSLFTGSSSVKAKVILLSGEMVTVDVDTFTGPNDYLYYNRPQHGGVLANPNGTLLTEDLNGAEPVGWWFQYTVNKNGEYSFEELESEYASVVSSAYQIDGLYPSAIDDDSDTIVDYYEFALSKDESISFGTPNGTKWTNSKTEVISTDKDGNVTSFVGLAPQKTTLEAQTNKDIDGDDTYDYLYTSANVLLVYSDGGVYLKGIYAVNQKAPLSSADITYAYALEQDDEGNIDRAWKFAFDGGVDYPILEDDVADKLVDKMNNNGQYIFNLILDDNGDAIALGELPGDQEIGFAYEDEDDDVVYICDSIDSNGKPVNGVAYRKDDNYQTYNIAVEKNVGKEDELDGPRNVDLDVYTSSGDKVVYIADTTKDIIYVAFIIEEAHTEKIPTP